MAHFKVKSSIHFEIIKKIMEISVWSAGSPSNVLTTQVYYCAMLPPYQIPWKAVPVVQQCMI